VTEKSIIIIGAGLAGLSTGCYAQMNGYQSRIFEHHTMPGGVATTWKREGYTIDGGIHFIMGHKPGTALHELYRELGTAQVSRFADMTTYGRFTDEASGRRLLRYFTGKYTRSVADYVRAVHDPWLRECIKNLFLPEVPVWFIFMILGLLADRQLGFLEGGSLDFVLAIEKRYKDLGGRVTYKATVEEILVETYPEQSRRDDRAIGVRLADGSEHCANVVVSAADGHNTIFKMLGGRYVNEKIKNTIPASRHRWR